MPATPTDDVKTIALTIDTHSGVRWPLLLVEFETMLLATGTGGGDLILRGACDVLGMRIVTNPIAVPPQVPGWRVELPGLARRGGIYAPHDQIIHEPLDSVGSFNSQWRNTAAATGGRCIVFVAGMTSELARTYRPDQSEATNRLALVAALVKAIDGRKVAGVVATVDDPFQP